MSDDYDTSLADIHDEMYREEEERNKGGFANLDPKTKFFVGAVVGLTLMLILLDKIPVKTGVITLAIGAIVLYMMQGEGSERKELTYIECMIRLDEQLRFLQNKQNKIGDRNQIPEGKIHILPLGRKQWYEGRGFKRSQGVEIYNADEGTTETYLIELDIYTGDIISYVHKPEGVTGDEKKDIKLMPTPEMRYEKKKDRYLGTTAKKFS